MAERTCKIVLVGDSVVGKTALVHRFINDNFQQVYIPTGFERYTADYDVGQRRVHFTIWDTSGASAYDTVRPLAYQDARVFLVCFRIDSPSSLENVLNKWVPEIRAHCSKNVPIVLCGCQNDVRFIDSLKQPKNLVTTEQAISAARALKAATYVETSSRGSERTVEEAFQVAALAATGRLSKSHLTLLLRKRNKLQSKKGHLRKSNISRQKSCILM